MSAARTASGRIPAQGSYHPDHEHDACGVGFVANIRGEKSHEVVSKAITVLINLEHRGACGCDPETGDGAGLLVQLPDAFLRRECGELGIELPEAGRYAAGTVFLANADEAAARQTEILESALAEAGQRVLGWRGFQCAAAFISSPLKRITSGSAATFRTRPPWRITAMG